MEVSNPYPSNLYQSNKEPQEKKMRYDEIGCDSPAEIKKWF